MSSQINELIATVPQKADEILPGEAEAADRFLVGGAPLVVRNCIGAWAAVSKARNSPEALGEYLLDFDTGAEVLFYRGAPETDGRVFYNADFSGLNCDVQRTSFSTALGEILHSARSTPAPLAYLGSAPINRHLAGFERENRPPLGLDGAPANIWIGGRSRISAHYDFSENLACVVAGRRRFILFPHEQLANLYVGPIDFTPAGQPISLVDFHKPDFARFPKFREALKAALIAELEPGDAIFIPSMWWHHVEALSPFNILVNYWFRRSPTRLDAPREALEHAIMTLRDLPPGQKDAWIEMFRYYVFENSSDFADHIPEKIRGILEKFSPEEARRFRLALFDRLNA